MYKYGTSIVEDLKLLMHAFIEDLGFAFIGHAR